MEIIPAIDVKGGRCVRLSQGREEAETIYSTDPVRVARQWVDEGAERLHVVNLDGAFGRDSRTLEILRSIVSTTGARVQFGGGLRSREAMRAAFEAGAAIAVLGTLAFENRALLVELLEEFGPDRVLVAIDARKGIVATRGWKELTGRGVREAAEDLMTAGVRKILYTDISRDGMMNGPDLSTLSLLAKTGLSILASGGISSLKDLGDVVSLGEDRITGAIIGKALYEGKIELRLALALAGAKPTGRRPTESPLSGGN